MKKIFMAAALVFSIALSAFSSQGSGGAECPDRCVSSDPNPVCCTTSGGSTYYGVIDNGDGGTLAGL